MKHRDALTRMRGSARCHILSGTSVWPSSWRGINYFLKDDLTGKRELDGGHPSHRNLIGWFLILVLGGPMFAILSYALVHAFLPRTNPNLVLLPLALSALFLIAAAFVITFIVQERRRRRISAPE